MRQVLAQCMLIPQNCENMSQSLNSKICNIELRFSCPLQKIKKKRKEEIATRIKTVASTMSNPTEQQDQAAYGQYLTAPHHHPRHWEPLACGAVADSHVETALSRPGARRQLALQS